MSKLFTFEDLAELTGKTWRTVRSRLRAAGVQPQKTTRKSELFASDDALAAIYGQASGPSELERESAALKRAQRQRTELDLRERSGELLLAADVATEWSSILVATRSHLRALPRKLAPRLVNVPDPATIATVMLEGIDEALTELANAEEAQ